MQTSAQSVAGLDLSLRGAGVVILKPDGEMVNARFGYSLSKGTERDVQERNLFISSKILSLLRKHEVKAVGIENYAFSQAGKKTMLAELTGTIKTQIIMALKVFPVVIGTTSIRAFLLPNPTTEQIRKKAPVHRYLESLGYHCDNGDEYDALAIAKILNVWINDRSSAFTEQQLNTLDRFDQQIRRTHARR